CRAGGGMPPCPPARSTPRGGRRSLRGSQPQILPPQPAPLHQAPEAGAGLRFDPPAQGCGVEIVKMAAVALEEEQSVAAPEGGGDQHVELYQVPKPQPPRELGELPGALVVEPGAFDAPVLLPGQKVTGPQVAVAEAGPVEGGHRVRHAPQPAAALPRRSAVQGRGALVEVAEIPEIPGDHKHLAADAEGL